MPKAYKTLRRMPSFNNGTLKFSRCWEISTTRVVLTPSTSIQVNPNVMVVLSPFHVSVTTYLPPVAAYLCPYISLSGFF